MSRVLVAVAAGYAFGRLGVPTWVLAVACLAFVGVALDQGARA
jgi:hypothetical protein